MNNQIYYIVNPTYPTIYNPAPIVNVPLFVNNVNLAPVTTFLIDNTFSAPAATTLLNFNQPTLPTSSNNGIIGMQPTFSSIPHIKVEPDVEPVKETDMNALAVCKTEIVDKSSEPDTVDITFDDILSEEENLPNENVCVKKEDESEVTKLKPVTKIEVLNTKQTFLENNTKDHNVNMFDLSMVKEETAIVVPKIEENTSSNGVLYINGTPFDRIDMQSDDGQKKVTVCRTKLWKPGQPSVADPIPPSEPTLTFEEVQKLVSLKCTECDFTTQNGVLDLRRHKLIHKGVKIYKCDVCTYQTSARNYLQVHKLVHSKNHQVKMHKCGQCAYQTRDYSNLLKHRRVHITPEEFEKLPYIYCSQCSYKTKWKDICVKHERIHKKPGEIRMYRCDKCSYFTRYGTALKKHSLSHKDITEIDFLKCTECSYMTVNEKSLKDHSIKHKRPEELEWFYCNDCEFKSPMKKKLKQHIITKHRKKSNNEEVVKRHKCHICSFSSTNRYGLKSHLVRHKNPADCEKFICAICSYETRLKEDLKMHIKRHAKQKSKEVET